MEQPITGVIGDNRSVYKPASSTNGLETDLDKRLQILSSLKHSMTNNSHTSSP
jgi:hypothetical protein